MQANIYTAMACPEEQFGPVFLWNAAPGGARTRQNPATDRAGVDLYDSSCRNDTTQALDDGIGWLLPPLDVTHDVLLPRT